VPVHRSTHTKANMLGTLPCWVRVRITRMYRVRITLTSNPAGHRALLAAGNSLLSQTCTHQLLVLSATGLTAKRTPLLFPTA
jgi:hypothetical protein